MKNYGFNVNLEIPQIIICINDTLVNVTVYNME